MGNSFYYTAQGRRIITQRHYVNYMDTRNYYLLTYGKTEGKRSNPLPTPDGEPTTRPTTYMASIYQNEDKFMSQTPGSGVR